MNEEVNEECKKGGQFLINSAQKCKSKLEVFMSLHSINNQNIL